MLLLLLLLLSQVMPFTLSSFFHLPTREFVLPDRKTVLKGFAREVDWDARMKRRQQEELGVEDEQQPQVILSIYPNAEHSSARCLLWVFFFFCLDAKHAPTPSLLMRLCCLSARACLSAPFGVMRGVQFTQTMFDP